jgi:CHAT domain-containing protein
MADDGSLVVRIWAGSEPGQYVVQAEGSSRDGQGQFQADLTRLEKLATELTSSRDERPDEAFSQAERIGNELFRAVFTGDIKSIYDEMLAGANHGSDLRIVLKLDGAPQLMDLPWEFLNDGISFVVLKASIVRYLNVAQRCRPWQVSGKVRMLAVGSSGPSGYAPLDIAGESAGIAHAIRSVGKQGLAKVVWAKPTLADLNEKLGQGEFNILHFFGHGDRDEPTGESGLVFVTGTGQTDLVKGRDLGALLAGHESLQLVVLNACEAARTDRRDPAKGVASELVRAGIPAVVAMQGAISDRAASMFASTFYQLLIDNGRPVDAALRSARHGLFAGDRKHLEWATPVLFSRTQDDRIFEFTGKKFPALDSTPADQLAPVGTESSGSATGGGGQPEQSTPPAPDQDLAKIFGSGSPPTDDPGQPPQIVPAPGTPGPPGTPAPEPAATEGLTAPPRMLRSTKELIEKAIRETDRGSEDLPPAAGFDPVIDDAEPPAPWPPAALQPATTQPAVTQNPASPSLAAVLGGTWVVQLQAPQYGVTTMTVTLIAFSPGQGQFEGNVWGTPVLVRGNWWSAGNQLQLQGARIIDGPFPQQSAYAVNLAFGSWNYQQLVGMTTVGEQTIWTRQS